MKIVLFVPGSGEDINSRNYQKTLNVIESAGYNTKFVPITWKYRALDHWVDEFMKTYKQHNPAETILAGFSFGAMIALVAAAKVLPHQLWLFSLSPYFAEDFPINKKWEDKIGFKRAKSFKATSFNNVAKNIYCRTLAFVGDKEVELYPSLGSRANQVSKQIKNSKVIIIPDAPHDVTEKNYLDYIQKNIAA